MLIIFYLFFLDVCNDRYDHESAMPLNSGYLILKPKQEFKHLSFENCTRHSSCCRILHREKPQRALIIPSVYANSLSYDHHFISEQAFSGSPSLSCLTGFLSIFLFELSYSNMEFTMLSTISVLPRFGCGREFWYRLRDISDLETFISS